MLGKISLTLSLLPWLAAIAGAIHCSFLSDQLSSERSIMSPSTMCSVIYFQPIWVVACLAFVAALAGLIFQGKSKLIFVSLILSGIIAVPMIVLFLRQALL